MVTNQAAEPEVKSGRVAILGKKLWRTVLAGIGVLVVAVLVGMGESRGARLDQALPGPAPAVSAPAAPDPGPVAVSAPAASSVLGGFELVVRLAPGPDGALVPVGVVAVPVASVSSSLAEVDVGPG